MLNNTYNLRLHFVAFPVLLIFQKLFAFINKKQITILHYFENLFFIKKLYYFINFLCFFFFFFFKSFQRVFKYYFLFFVRTHNLSKYLHLIIIIIYAVFFFWFSFPILTTFFNKSLLRLFTLSRTFFIFLFSGAKHNFNLFYFKKTRLQRISLLRSPFVHKKSFEHFGNLTYNLTLRFLDFKNYSFFFSLLQNKYFLKTLAFGFYFLEELKFRIIFIS